MARKGTTRRSVSVKGVTYARMKIHAVDTGRSVSDLAEEWANAEMDKLGIRTFTKEEAESMRPKNGGAPLVHPHKRANAVTPKAAAPVAAPEKVTPKVPTPKAELPKSAGVVEARAEEVDVPPRKARPAKEPTLAPAPPKEPPRGGGVHSF